MWIVAIRRDAGKHFNVTESTKVCLLHFKKEDFVPGYVNGRKFLKERIVPSEFKISACKMPRRNFNRHNPVPPANLVDTPAAIPDDEANSAAASANQPLSLKSILPS